MSGMNVPRQKKIKLKCLVLGAAGAGKTSILRRYFYKTFEGTRVPTLGSDFYTGRMTLPVLSENDADNDQLEVHEVNKDESENGNEEGPEQHSLSLQMWDTPGRERFYVNKEQRKLTASLTDSFLRQADAIMLVYDMTSSTSFTQLLRWYADLMESVHPLPILIVGTKLDIFEAAQQRETTLVHPRRVRQRDVMGIGRDFRGKDFRYEYRVSPPTAKSKSGRGGTVTRKRPPRARNDGVEMSYFLANRSNWTKDINYLDSLLNSEDGSHPDRDMVLLWCMRNGLKHLEVSAATGEGVEGAVRALVKLALDAQERAAQEQEAKHREKQLQSSEENHRRYRELDLRERYASKDQMLCCFGPLLRLYKRWFKS